MSAVPKPKAPLLKSLQKLNLFSPAGWGQSSQPGLCKTFLQSSCWHLGHRLLASRTVRQYISLVQATKIVVFCYDSPEKLMHHLKFYSSRSLRRAGLCQSPLTLCVTPWTVARQAPLSVGFSRQEHPSGLPCPPPGDLPDPGIEPVFLKSPALAGGFLTISTTSEAIQKFIGKNYICVHNQLDQILLLKKFNPWPGHTHKGSWAGTSACLWAELLSTEPTSLILPH